MPNRNLILWVLALMLVIGVFNPVVESINKNPWERWAVFPALTFLFFIFAEYAFSNYHNEFNRIGATIGAFISFAFIVEHTIFFMNWWNQGFWLVVVFYIIIASYLLYRLLEARDG